jgi:hypothetical protein
MGAATGHPEAAFRHVNTDAIMHDSSATFPSARSHDSGKSRSAGAHDGVYSRPQSGVREGTENQGQGKRRREDSEQTRECEQMQVQIRAADEPLSASALKPPTKVEPNIDDAHTHVCSCLYHVSSIHSHLHHTYSPCIHALTQTHGIDRKRWCTETADFWISHALCTRAYLMIWKLQPRYGAWPWPCESCIRANTCCKRRHTMH